MLTFVFWFRVTGPPFTPVIGRAILIVMGVLVVGGGALYLGLKKFAPKLSRERKLALIRLALLCFWCGAFGFLLYVFTWQGVPGLSMRFLWLVWGGIFVGVAAWLVARWFRTIPALDRERAAREAYEKWLPKPKK